MTFCGNMADNLQFEVSEGWASRMAAATNPLYAQYNSSHRYHSGEYVYITKNHNLHLSLDLHCAYTLITIYTQNQVHLYCQ